MSSWPPKRTTYTGPSFRGPGIIYITSRLISPLLSPETFNTWYVTVHIPDLLATGAVSSAYRFKALKPTSDAPYLTIYVLPDMGALQKEEAKFKAIPMTHASLSDGGPIQKFAEFDTRYYQLIQSFGGPGDHTAGVSPFTPLLGTNEQTRKLSTCQAGIPQLSLPEWSLQQAKRKI